MSNKSPKFTKGDFIQLGNLQIEVEGVTETTYQVTLGGEPQELVISVVDEKHSKVENNKFHFMKQEWGMSLCNDSDLKEILQLALESLEQHAHPYTQPKIDKLQNTINELNAR